MINYMENLEARKTTLEQESLSDEVVELKMREQELREQLEKVRKSIADKEKKITDKELLEKHKAAIKKGEEKLIAEGAETKAAIQREKFKMLQEEWKEKEKARKEEEARTAHIDVAEEEKFHSQAMKEKEATKWEETKEKMSEWKEEQKTRAKEILKKFFEKESASAPSELRRDKSGGREEKEILIDEAEQEKLIHEALRDREAERLLRESPARADLELAMKNAREELKKPEELKIVEIKFFEEGELPEKIETDLLTESKKFEATAGRAAALCKKLEKQMKEKGIDVNKMELSFTERMKFKIKSRFDKNLRNWHRSFELARMAEDADRAEAFELRLSATSPKDYIKLAAEKAVEVIAKRRVEKLMKAKQPSVSPIGWVKRI